MPDGSGAWAASAVVLVPLVPVGTPGVIVLAVMLVAIFADLIAPHAPDLTDNSVFLVPPAWQTGGSSAHLLGTDAIGRDILSRVILGARGALSIALTVVITGVAAAIAVRTTSRPVPSTSVKSFALEMFR